MAQWKQEVWREEFQKWRAQYEYQQRHQNSQKENADARMTYEDALEYLASINVPISPTGDPLGIGWDE